MDDLAVALAELAEAANYHAAAGEEAAAQAVSHFIEAGRCLNRAKDLIPHGGWQRWLQGNWQKSERTAQLYMQLARRYDEQQLEAATPDQIEGVRDAIAKLLSAGSGDAEPAPLPPQIAGRLAVGDLSPKQAQQLASAVQHVDDPQVRSFVERHVTNVNAVQPLVSMAESAPEDFEVLVSTGYLQVGEEVIPAGDITPRDLARVEEERRREEYLQQQQAGRRIVALDIKCQVLVADKRTITLAIEDLDRQCETGDWVYITIEKEVKRRG